MTYLLALALSASLVVINNMVLKRSGGWVDFLWILGGFYLLSFIYNETIFEGLSIGPAKFHDWRNSLGSDLFGVSSAVFDWLIWLNWISILILITSLFRVNRAADAARGSMELLAYNKKNADAESRHYHATFIGYLPQMIVFYILSYLIYPTHG